MAMPEFCWTKVYYDPEKADIVREGVQDYHLYNGSETLVPKSVSDVERAARAIVTRMGFDPDALACRYTPRQVGAGIMIVPPSDHQRPLWTFFTAEAEAALSVLDI